MAAYRILNQAPQYLLPSGRVNAGGSLTFYETDLTTLKNTWSDPAKTTLNSNPVTLDAAGRTTTDVWGDGEYGVVMKDALGTGQWTRNNVRPGDGTAATTLPTLGAGQFISSDGSVLIAVDIIQVPDMTGEADRILSNDGVVAFWIDKPTPPVIPDPDIVITLTPNKSLQLGVSDDTTKYFAQYGSDSVGPSGTKTVSDSVVFPTAFSAAPWFVDVVPTSGQAATDGAYVTWHVTSISTTGFTVTFNIPDDDSRPEWQIGNTINYIWKAEGTVVVTP
jgi:hypothetical protein